MPTAPEKENDSGIVRGEDGLRRPTWASADATLRAYYDTEWGMPILDEQGMFERLSLEVFQAGLSWATVLRKRSAFREAFADFSPEVVAKFTEKDVEELLQNERIIRNRTKILATIINAGVTLRLREQGGLAAFIWSFQPLETPQPEMPVDVPSRSAESTALANALRAEGFKFVGPVNMFALMEATGIIDTHLVASHRRGSSGVWPS